MQAAIEVQNLGVTLNGRTILEDINLTINQGEFIAILGPNGAGKSTLLKLLLGLYKPTAGEIKILGKTPKTGNNEIGYAPQHRTLEENVALRARDIIGFGIDGNKWGIGLPNKKRDKQIEHALKEVDMLRFADMPVGRLSGGEQQRILIAQALITNPKVLFLDEPLSNLDISHGQAVVSLVSSVARARDITTLLVTHDINPIMESVDRVIYIANTHSKIGKPKDIITSQELTQLYGSPIEVVHAQGKVFVVGDTQ